MHAPQVHHLTDAVNQNLARSAYGRFLGVRRDHLPAIFGATASRLRSYKNFRGFLIKVTPRPWSTCLWPGHVS